MGARIVMVGAGSIMFGHTTIVGIFSERESLAGSTLVLVDIDKEKLELAEGFTRAVNTELGSPFTIEATTDCRDAMPGADFVIISVERDLYKGWGIDWEVPNRHGFVQMMGENGGPGGLSHSFRTINLVMEICRDIEELAPDALVLNYTNPMSRVCLALTRHTDLRVVGLCHQIQMAYSKVGRVMGWIDAKAELKTRRASLQVVMKQVDIRAAGLNHMTFITAIHDRATGEDLYPEFSKRLHEVDVADDPDPISRLVYGVFGLFPTAGDDHLGEYIPWARPKGHPFEGFLEEDAIEERKLSDLMRAVADGKSARDALEGKWGIHGADRAPWIISAIVGGRDEYELAVNIVNNGAIAGLPDWAVVEVPGVAGPSGVSGLAMGSLPPGVTALLDQQIRIQDRVVEAAVNADRRAALEALLLDPITSRDAEAATRMLDELLTANAPYIPEFT